MARVIENYRDLQDGIADWLNRADIQDRIPTFVYLAERRIFRRYRMPNNEKTIQLDMRVDPDPMATDPAQIDVTDKISYPPDYLEMLTITANGQPLQRISLTELQNRQRASQSTNSNVSIGSQPQVFARERLNFEMWPAPTGDTLVELIYYCDFSGGLVADEDDNDILRNAPDLYLYGSLLQAQPFLKPTDDEWQLLPTWRNMYEEAFAELEVMRDSAEFSGSVNEIQNSFGGSVRVRSGSVDGL